MQAIPRVAGDLVQVLEGLKLGERVATEGSFLLRAEAARTRSGGSGAAQRIASGSCSGIACAGRCARMHRRHAGLRRNLLDHPTE